MFNLEQKSGITSAGLGTVTLSSDGKHDVLTCKFNDKEYKVFNINQKIKANGKPYWLAQLVNETTSYATVMLEEITTKDGWQRTKITVSFTDPELKKSIAERVWTVINVDKGTFYEDKDEAKDKQAQTQQSHYQSY